MACTKGRINPSPQTKLRLFSDAAGYCQRPGCMKELFSEQGEEDYHIAEMAHILAANDDGPRANIELSALERATYENFILLCPNCHTEIDKAPDTFPDYEILEWKRNHKQTIQNTFGVRVFQNRKELRSFIEPLLSSNRVIFNNYGPNNDYRENPEAEEAAVWKRKLLSQIIPNNQKILLTLDKNRFLATESERITIDLFRQHVDDLIECHIGEKKHVAKQFPQEMNDLFVETLGYNNEF